MKFLTGFVILVVCAGVQSSARAAELQDIPGLHARALSDAETLFTVDGRRDYIGPRWWWKAAIYMADGAAAAATFGASVPLAVASCGLLGGAAVHDIHRGNEVRGLNKILGHSHQDSEKKQEKYLERTADLCVERLLEVMPPDSELLKGEKSIFFSTSENALFFCKPPIIEADDEVQPRHYIYRATGVKVQIL